jgi:parallel beta-helix repeat protein
MKRRRITSIFLCVLMVAAVFPVLGIPMNVSAETIIVPDDYPTIQEAIDAAWPWDTVYVRAGTYYENLVMVDGINLVGEHRDTTIIDGGGGNYVISYDWSDPLHEIHSYTIQKFTVRNADDGIILDKYCEASNNRIEDIARYGISIQWFLNTVSSNIINGCEMGILTPDYNTIRDNTINNCNVGISELAGYNTIQGNIMNSCNDGIWITGDYSEFDDNIINANSIGLNFIGPYYRNYISQSNTVNGEPVYHFFDVHGTESNPIILEELVLDAYDTNDLGKISLIDCSYFKIRDNLLSNNEAGRGIFLCSSNNVEIVDNTISNNGRGIDLDDSSNSRIYHNNFIDNCVQAEEYPNNGNQWDDGYPSGGNYWSDADLRCGGVYDDYIGTNQDIPGRDGIVDAGLPIGGLNPYPIWPYSQDNYPIFKESDWLNPNWIQRYVHDFRSKFIPTHVVTGIINAPSFVGDDVVATYLSPSSADIGGVAWFDNLGSSFSPPRIIDDTIIRPWGVDIGDLNGDGTNDIVVAGDLSCVYWYANDGFGGFFGPYVLDFTLYEPKEVFIADINGDTLPDVVATGSGDKNNIGLVKWYQNMGGGLFAPGLIVDTMPWAHGLYVEDVNDDMELDIIVSSTGSSTIASDGMVVYYTNMGMGTYWDKIVIDNARDGCENVYATDIDMDGLVDIVASMSENFDYNLGWYKNHGLDRFSPLILIDFGLEFNGLDVADINLDGRDDIVIATGSADNWVLWYEKPLDPLNDPWMKNVIDDDPDPIPANAKDVSVGAIDEDLDLDVVAALYGHTAITWYENPLI